MHCEMVKSDKLINLGWLEKLKLIKLTNEVDFLFILI